MRALLRTMSAVAIATGALLMIPGCASTQTQESAGEYIDDASITAAVKSKLIGDSSVKARDIEVETFRGTVQLSGFADDTTQINRAVEIARGTKGVKSVRNDVRLKTPPPAKQ